MKKYLFILLISITAFCTEPIIIDINKDKNPTFLTVKEVNLKQRYSLFSKNQTNIEFEIFINEPIITKTGNGSWIISFKE